MKHIATIQNEFVKEARKWDDLTYEEQKAYLSRHPKSKRKVTARPGKGQKKEVDEVKKKVRQKKTEVKPERKTKAEAGTYAELAAKLEGRSYEDISDEIATLQVKMDKRNSAAARREQRAHGDLDGTAFEAAYEKNRPLEIRQKLLQHYLEHGSKKLPKDLQSEFDELKDDLERQKEMKERRKERREKDLGEHGDLMDKIVTWKSRKHFGKEFSARVVAVKSGKRGPYVKTDIGWKVPVSLITDSKNPPKSERNKVQVKPAELVGKEIRWKTKYRQKFRRPSRRGPYRPPKAPPPGYDSATQTAGGVVDGVKGSKLLVGNYRVPITIVQKVEGEDFDGWKSADE